MAGAKDMNTKNSSLIAAMEARNTTPGAPKKIPEKPEDARTGPGQLAIFSGQLADAITRAEAAETEVERLKEASGSSTELTDARQRLTEAEAALATALAKQPRQKAMLAELHEVPGRRRRLTAEQYAELRANLEHNPLAHPVAVRIRKAGGYEIISGNNRVAIYRELGRSEIDITVLELSDDDTERTAFYSNLLSPSLTDYEKYLGFKQRMLTKGYSQSQVATEAGVSQPYISFLMAFDDLPKAALCSVAGAPALFGANTVLKLAALAKAGKELKVIEASQKLATGELKSQDAAVRHVTADASGIRAARPAPRVIRQGKAKYCEVLRADKTVRLSFASAADAEATLAAITALLEARANETKGVK